MIEAETHKQRMKKIECKKDGETSKQKRAKVYKNSVAASLTKNTL